MLIALVAAILATLVPLVVIPIGVLVPVVGTGLVVLGMTRHRRPAIDLGAAGLLAGCVLSGSVGGPVVLVLLGAISAVIAWDTAHYGVLMREQLGVDADTVRIEAVHAGASTAVGIGLVIVVVALLSVVPTVGTVVTGGLLLIAALAFVHVVCGEL